MQLADWPIDQLKIQAQAVLLQKQYCFKHFFHISILFLIPDSQLRLEGSRGIAPRLHRWDSWCERCRLGRVFPSLPHSWRFYTLPCDFIIISKYTDMMCPNFNSGFALNFSCGTQFHIIWYCIFVCCLLAIFDCRLKNMPFVAHFVVMWTVSFEMMVDRDMDGPIWAGSLWESANRNVWNP